MLLLSAVLTAIAQTISVNAPQRVSTGEQFRLSYTIKTNNVRDFREGNIPDGFEVLYGPSYASQQNIQVINGHTTGSSSTTVTYLLYASKPGTYTIPAATALINGHTVSSASVKITVSGSATQQGQNAGAQQSSTASQQSAASKQISAAGTPISDKDLFIRVSANKERVHEQEAVLITYKAYAAPSIHLTHMEGKMPDLNGFHSQEVELPQQKSLHIENVNGRQYQAVTWSQYVIYPQKTGKIEIPPITFKGIVAQENRYVDPFEALFNGGSNYVEVKKDIIAPAITIQVDELPSKPAGFSGGVGKFTISANLVNASIRANDAATIRVVISGNGNLKLIKEPQINWPKDFDVYDAKVTDKTKLTSNGVEGNMIFDCMASPHNAGDYEIPAIEFTYYDTASNSYKTIKTEPFKLNVTPADASDSNEYTSKLIDIHDIKKGDAETTADDNFFLSPVYWSLFAIIVIVFVTLIIVFHKRALDNADIVKMRGKKANKVATKRLKRAAKLMREHRQMEFYDEVLRALWGYVGDKMNIPVSELSRDNITDRLLQQSVDDITVSTFVNAIDECEYARYAPGEAQSKMSVVYEKAMRGITDIDTFLSSKKKKDMKESEGTLMAIIIGTMMLMATSVSAAPATKASADALYAKKQYSDAIAEYKSLITKHPSAELYYNLGNAYYRCDSLPQAILSYERSLKLDPSDDDCRDNLNFIRTKTIDKIQPHSNVLISLWHNTANILHPTSWAVISIILLVCAVALLLIYLFMDTLLLRRIGFFGGIASVVMLIVCTLLAWSQTSAMTSTDGAIVITPSCSIKKTPTQKSADQCVIHEATHVTITDDAANGWYEVELDNGVSGWLEKSNVERI